MEKCCIGADTVNNIAINGSLHYHTVIKLDSNHGGCLIKAGINSTIMKSVCAILISITIIVAHRCPSAGETQG